MLDDPTLVPLGQYTAFMARGHGLTGIQERPASHHWIVRRV